MTRKIHPRHDFFYGFRFYLLIGCSGLLSLCRLFSSCSEQGSSLAAEHRLRSVQAAVVVARWLSCSAACGVFLDQGSNSCLLHWQADSLPLSPQGSLMFICVFSAALGLRCGAQAFSCCSEWGRLSSCSVWASHCSGFCCCRAHALGCTGSVVVVCGLSCPVACGIFLNQKSNLCHLHWQADS